MCLGEERSAIKLQLATIGDDNLLVGFAGLRAHRLQLLEHIHALDHRPEHHMPIVQPGRLHRGDEELGAVGVGPRIRHRQDARSRVFQREILILELVAVDRLAPGAIVIGEVATLTHEVGDDAMEGGALVAEPFFAGAQRTEVVRRLGHHIGAELQITNARGVAHSTNNTYLHDDATDGLIVRGHVKVHTWQTHFIRKIPDESCCCC